MVLTFQNEGIRRVWTQTSALLPSISLRQAK